ncbi:hypothetical protein [Deminuibacter soli]|uniref:Uncharacterized protein n=1 Tax=Deminuibacter soli TaxID=2291815 RepID=A0A3E1NR61_9BACT|nr:hypothetical protein [Deminuibacter soli]RFM30268.1 hypothetical protein DXN05_04680 [Deminuibacter soli]
MKMPASKTLLAFVTFFLLLSFTIATIAAWAQGSTVDSDAHMHMNGHSDASFWFGLMELPFLFICVVFAFMTASALRGGKFGRGMNLLAWGFLVMAVGHLHMQLDHFYNLNLFRSWFGSIGGALAWFVALVVTWLLSATGFYSMYKAGKGR